MSDDAFIPDEGEALKDDIFSDPAYLDYSDLLHGPYIAALIRRSEGAPKTKKGGGKHKQKQKTQASEPFSPSASTLSASAREAFRDAQEEIKWVPIYSQDKPAVDVVGGADDAWEIVPDPPQTDQLARDFATETTPETVDDDFVPASSIDDDFEVRARP